MTSISSTTGSLGSLTSYYKLLASAQSTTDDTAETDTETKAKEATTAAATQLATGSLAMLGAASDSSASTGSDPLSQLLGSTFTNTNSLLSQLNTLITGDGSATTDTGTDAGATAGAGAAGSTTDAASKQQQIQAILAKLMSTQTTDSLSLFT